jgi:hypothetical protein
MLIGFGGLAKPRFDEGRFSIDSFSDGFSSSIHLDTERARCRSERYDGQVGDFLKVPQVPR